MPNVAILGSTGSIGTQTLQVIDENPDFRVAALTAHSNTTLLAEQVRRYRVGRCVIERGELVSRLASETGIPVLAGVEGLCEVATLPDVDIVVIALVGAAGLAPAIAALQAGKRVALANKETLVVAGHLIMAYQGQLIPIDSEHNALWQCLDGKNRCDVAELILTASGGPFRDYDGDLGSVSVDQALAHPNWKMGSKISIDSATLMNKGLEVIEAHWLFGMEYSQITVILHPQSVIHSLVRFRDGSLLAQMATTDMRMPIQYALTYPQMRASSIRKLDLATVGTLTFAKPDMLRFPCLDLAYQAGFAGGTMPTVLNAANEIAVELFLSGRIRFTEIAGMVEWALSRHDVQADPSLAQILEVDQTVRAELLALVASAEGRMMFP